jgi:hypothetical protein
MPGSAPDPPDTHSQLESLLHQVWLSEAEWRFDDRLELQLSLRTRETDRG